MYRVYLRDFQGHVPLDTKTNTPSATAAAEAFTALVNRADLDGQKWAAVLSYNNGQLAFHRFDSRPGDADYWRGKMSEIPWPLRRVGRPVEIDGGKRVNVYLDAESAAIAAKLGNGNVSDGIRKALTKSNFISSTP